MMRLPSDITLGHLTDGLRALNRAPRDKPLAAMDRTLLESIERRLARAVTRDRTGHIERDGYPRSTLGNESRGIGTPTSTTETAALSRSERDAHHELTALAVTALTETVTSLGKLVSALASLDQLTSDRGPAPRTCNACAGKRPLGGDQLVARRGTVGDRLTTATDLCQPCWDFVRQTAPAGSNAGYLPTEEQIRWHDQRGRWRLRMVAS